MTEPVPADWTSQQAVEPAPSSTGDLNRLKQAGLSPVLRRSSSQSHW